MYDTQLLSLRRCKGARSVDQGAHLERLLERAQLVVLDDLLQAALQVPEHRRQLRPVRPRKLAALRRSGRGSFNTTASQAGRNNVGSRVASRPSSHAGFLGFEGRTFITLNPQTLFRVYQPSILKP